MKGLSPEDPRFEKAVFYGLWVMRRSPLNAQDKEDLAQEIRIALLDHGGPAPKLCARYTALDWWRGQWGRIKDGRIIDGKVYGHRRREVFAPVWERKRATRGELENLSQRMGPMEAVQSKEASPEEVLARRSIQRVLEQMDSRLGFILQRYYLDGMLARDVAKELGLSEPRVCQLMHKAEQQFRLIWRTLEFREAA